LLHDRGSPNNVIAESKMKTPIRAALLGLMLSSATGLLAQETTTPAPAADPAPADATTTPAPAEQDPVSGFSTGTPLEGATDPAPQVGQPYIAETSGDWSLRCLKTETGTAEPCQLYQLLKDGDGNNVAEISMFPLPENNRAAVGATIVAPLETLLTEQLTLSIDGGAPKQYPFTFCNPAGCVARVGFTAEELAQFKRGRAATLRMVPAAAPDQEVLLNISLTGFTSGFDKATPPSR
jgi:invasion protein IalB